jgi:hypothetical protein
MTKMIKNIDELRSNLLVLDNYLSKDEEEEKFAKNLVRRGICFVAYKINSEWRFAPSRFIGYANNSMSIHKGNYEKDGRKTNPVISRVIKRELKMDDSLEEEYFRYCRFLGI